MVMILLRYGERSSIFDSLLGTCWKENKGKILQYGIIHHGVDAWNEYHLSIVRIFCDTIIRYHKMVVVGISAIYPMWYKLIQRL